MSSEEITIQVDRVSKCFNIYDRPRDRLKQLVAPYFQAAAGRDLVTYHREYWALRDVSFEVKRGQTVGIIGQNGSGKSTLLQIITGTMAPTLGTVDISGRIAALLELGSGFNPEFTGRENVFLNGSLLGLSRTKIEEKFDYIAAFADIGEHLEHPVKTYSSGMMLRLAFAVQVAVETEVLIIDEALAVGDARFQLKCFKRLEELKARGTTILFVSHATELVRSFCDFGLVLNKGKTIYWGDAKSATVKYLEAMFPAQNQFSIKDEQKPSFADTSEAADEAHSKTTETAPYALKIDPSKLDNQSFGIGGAILDWLEVHGVEKPNLVTGGQEIKIRCHFSWSIEFIRSLVTEQGLKADIGISIALSNKKGEYIFGCNGFDYGFNIDPLSSGKCEVEFSITLPHLTEGEYFLVLAIPVGDLNNHIQLKWYDALLSLNYIQSQKRAFGLLGVEYKISKINRT